MHPPASAQSGVLPSNAEAHADPRDEVPSADHDEVFADVAVGVGVLALLATGLTILGHQFGGPMPRLGFWRAFAPLLLLPVAILLAMVLGPGAQIEQRLASTRRRVGLAAAGLGLFSIALVSLNGPSVLLLGQ